jgi:hypothetical protein
VHSLSYKAKELGPPAGHWWLTSVILATWEAKIRRIWFEASPRQIVLETLSQKNPSPKRAGGVDQAVRAPS